ncbi:MAG: hypothetical protein Q7R39_04695 [Dehalococcoidia bacterium]|nr:hypothetical protein [Dehalococcoidia bacterium]
MQQDLRQSANDPQIQMAEDAALAIEKGQAPQSVVPSTTVDISKSLAAYLIVFDDAGKPVASSAQLDGQTPRPPSGVFDQVRQRGEDRITWEPKPGVRSAAVVARFSGLQSGFVLAGRSLREVEKREDGLRLEVVMAWALSLAATLFVISGIAILSEKKAS